MSKRVVAACLTAILAFGSGIPAATADTGSPAAGMFAPEEWVPVPKPAAVDRGPEPGSVCQQRGAVAEFVEITGSRFDVEGVVSTTNDIGDAPIPLMQTIKESKTKKWWTNISVGIKVGKELNRKYSWEYSREMVWSLGQTIGPYNVNKGETGRLSWGFLVDEFAGTTVRCGDSGKWESTGHRYFGIAPRERHVEVNIQ